MRDNSKDWVSDLLRWFAGARRAMPWRSRPSAYAVWVSEVMLQQTQVDTVVPYFRRFMGRFPSLKRLAAADPQDVLKAWEGLGYYSRARNLKAAAERITREHGGRMPRRAAELMALPGVGEYTAAAIASICFGEVIPVVDGNVLRVAARLRGIEEAIALQRVRRRIAAELAPFVPEDRPGDFNQAMMELGALICRPRHPLCARCPLRQWCSANRAGAVDRLPVRTPGKAVPHYHVIAGVIGRGGKVLILRRPERGLLGGMWEFPCGRKQPREALEQALTRCLLETTGLSVTGVRPLCVVKHAYSHFRMTLHVYTCRATTGCATVLAAGHARWRPVSSLEKLPFSVAHRKIADRLREMESG